MSAADFVAQFEGFEPRAYYCPAGVLTLGFGSTRDAAGKPIALGATITPAEAHKLLERDLCAAAADVARLVKVPLTDGQRDALTSFTYNLGGGALASSTLLRLLNARRYGDAGREFPRWNKGGGQVLAGLVRRREAERKLFMGET